MLWSYENRFAGVYEGVKTINNDKKGFLLVLAILALLVLVMVGASLFGDTRARAARNQSANKPELAPNPVVRWTASAKTPGPPGTNITSSTAQPAR